MYQVGLMETDKHIQYFWRALESFSQVGPALYREDSPVTESCHPAHCVSQGHEDRSCSFYKVNLLLSVACGKRIWNCVVTFLGICVSL